MRVSVSKLVCSLLSKTRKTLLIYTCMPYAHLYHLCSFDLPDDMRLRVNGFETVIIKFSLTSCQRFSLWSNYDFAPFLQYPQMKYNPSIKTSNLQRLDTSYVLTRLASFIPLRHLQCKHLIKYKLQLQSSSIFYSFL